MSQNEQPSREHIRHLSHILKKMRYIGLNPLRIFILSNGAVYAKCKVFYSLSPKVGVFSK